MTPKDYVKIAEILRAERERTTMRAATQAVANLTRAMADMLADDNPEFDRERFYVAAGAKLN